MKSFYFAASLVALGANGSTLFEYMFVHRDYPSQLSQSARIAEVEKERIADLAKEVDGVVCFLPIDSAWTSFQGAVDALVNEPEGNVRYDLLLAACAAVPQGYFSLDALKQYGRENGGIVDSAYGSSYTINDKGQLCQYEWVAGDYQEAGCANIVGTGKVLDDGAIYIIDTLLLPEDIEVSLNELVNSRRRRV